MNLPKLPRVAMRSESEPGYEKASWRPTWKCFCCHDTGIVNPHLAALVIEGYNASTDKIPICQNTNCTNSIGETISQSNSIDWRINTAICQQLDLMERENWERWEKEKHTLRKQAIALTAEFAQAASLRNRDRNPEEIEIARKKHEEVISQL